MKNKATELKTIQVQQQTQFAKTGLFWGALSGATWGIVGLMLGMALGMQPFSNQEFVLHSSPWALLSAPLVGACLHDSFAALWLIIYNFSTGRIKEYIRTVRTKPGLMVCVGGILGGPVFMSGYLISMHLSGTFYGLAITAMYPIIGSVLAIWILKEISNVRLWLGILLCIAGAIVIGYDVPDNNSYPYYYPGLFAAFLAAVGLSMEGIISTIGMDMVDPNIAMGIRQLTSCVVYLVVILPLVSGYDTLIASINQKSFWMIALAGFIGGYSFQVWYRGLNMAGVGRTMALNITYALWGIFFGWLFTDQIITPYLFFGAVLITAGAITTVLKPKEFLLLRKV